MSVLSKLVTLMRGSVRELGESVIDANGTRIYEQEIVDARNSIAQAKNDLTLVMAKEMQAAREIARLKGEMARYETMAVEALNKDKQDLAEEVALKVAEIEGEMEAQVRMHSDYALKVAKLKELIKTGENRVREHERELAMAKTTESVYRATATISQNVGAGGSKLMTAKESLDRIKQRHQDLSDRMLAAEQLDSETGAKALENKLAAAGIGENVERKNRVMERIRARQAAESGDQGGNA
ncbi:MAG: phage shock protein [Moraxellaceae bacterium]|jgi:phage shock protein A|nr:phage shock protein [Moraxellaceae bacterium]MDF3031145.1 phage shock protein [Moraxellaceae bacterium]